MALEPTIDDGSLDFDDHVTVIKVPDPSSKIKQSEEEQNTKTNDHPNMFTTKNALNPTSTQQCQDLLNACQAFNLKEIQRLCKNSGVNVNYQSLNGRTPLMYLLLTTSWGSGELDDRKTRKILSMMDVLLRHNNCDINISDNNNETAFYHACEFGNASILRKLIEFGCNVVDNKLNTIMNDIIVKNGHYKLLLMLIQMFPIEYYCDILNNTILHCQHCNKLLKEFKINENINDIGDRLCIDITAKEFDKKLKENQFVFEQFFDLETNYFIKNILFKQYNNVNNMYDLQLKLNIKFNNDKKKIISYIHNKILQNKACARIFQIQYDWLSQYLTKYDKNSHNGKRIAQFIEKLEENVEKIDIITNNNNNNTNGKIINSKLDEKTDDDIATTHNSDSKDSNGKNSFNFVKNDSKLRNFTCLFGKQEIDLSECHCIYYCDNCLYYNHNLENPYICHSCAKYACLLRYCMLVKNNYVKARTESQQYAFWMSQHNYNNNKKMKNNKQVDMSPVALIMTKTLYGNTQESKLSHYLSMKDWDIIAWDKDTIETVENHVKWCLKLRNIRFTQLCNILSDNTSLSYYSISIVVWFLFGIQSLTNGCKMMLKNVNYQ